MGNSWHEWVRKVAKEKGISYMCAISEASKTYKKKTKEEKKAEDKKIKDEIKKTGVLLTVKSFNDQLKELGKNMNNKILFQRAANRWFKFKPHIREAYLEKYPKKKAFLTSLESNKDKVFKMTAKEYMKTL